MITLAREKGPGAVADAMITGMVGKGTRSRSPQIVDEVHRMLAAAHLEGTIGALEALKTRLDSLETLATIDVPTLIVVGEEDAITPVSESRLMHEAIRGSLLEIIFGAGHVSNVERPAAFNHVLSEFLSSLTLV
jgi:pimeloyl-ACP methyl ester carboxylesterase